MASSSDAINKLSSAAKQSSSPDNFEKSGNGVLSSSLSSENNSSPESPLGDSFGVEEEEKEETLLQNSRVSVVDDDPRMDNGHFQNHAAQSSLAVRDESPTGEHSVTSGDSKSANSIHVALESPPNQAMERSNMATSTTTSHYRIPSHVFNRSQSNTPVEWSMTSNESLFSIQMGNTSFNREQFSSWPLDDVEIPVESSPSSNLKFNSSGALPPAHPQAPASAGSKSVDASCRELGVSEETEEVVPRQSSVDVHDHDDVKPKPAAPVLSPGPVSSHQSVESDHDKATRGKINNESSASGTPKNNFTLKENNSNVAEKRVSGVHMSRMSGESNNSTKSFAFPILEGVDKSTSISMSNSSILGRDPWTIHSQRTSTPKRQQVVTDQRQSEFTNASSPEAAIQQKSGTGWFPCLSICSCCR